MREWVAPLLMRAAQSSCRPRHAAALVLALLATAAFVPGAASAQDSAAPPLAEWPADDGALGTLDPDAPLAPLPEIGVEWPEFDTPLPPLPALPPEGATMIAEAGAAPPIPATDAPVLVDGGDAADMQDLALPPPLDPVPGGGADAIVAVGIGTVPAEIGATGTFRYRVELGDFGDAADDIFRSRFAGLSRLEAEDGDPANAAQLNRRIVEDGDLLNRLLRNAGYYDASVVSAISSSGDRLVVRFGAQPGPRYAYDAVRLAGLDAAGAEEAARLAEEFPVAVADPIIADDLIAAQVRLERVMRETGYPFGDVGQELVTIDHDTRTGALDQPVTPGQRLRFGRIIADDDGLLGARHMQRIARFRPDDWYRQSAVDDLQRALIATGLVASVDIAPVAAPTGETVDLNVALEAAPLRTLAGALGYGTDEGIRLEASWEHRNLFPPEGALILRGVAGTQEQLASVTYRRNNFMRRDRTLSAQLIASHLRRNAFDARTVQFTTRFERQSTLIFQKHWSWSAGADLLITDERNLTRIAGAVPRATYYIASLPLFLGYDRSDDLLDPTRGFRLSARVAPELSMQGTAFTYVRAQIDGSAYLPVSDRVVLAGRARVGTITGADIAAIAPSRRYYAGGGGSVRGFGYQAIGPVDVLGDPTGGRSLLELAVEARVRIGVFSVVPFVDAGNVSDNSLPGLDDLRVGAGLGVRYHSSFGPIRVDVGTPINPRAGDSRVAVYVSLGQAF